MKVVWLCNYSIYHIKDKIDINIDFRNISMATWLLYLKEEILANYKNVELSIIFYGFFKKDHIVREENITYYALNFGYEFIMRILNRTGLKFITKYLFNRIEKKLAKKVKSINPDIINVHGTENLFGKIANELNYPTLVTIQGFAFRALQESNPLDYQKIYKKIFKHEIEVLERQKYFQTVRGHIEDFVRSYNKNAHFFRLFYPISDYAFSLFDKQFTKNNDLIFVGGLLKRKGIEDFIKAIDIIKNKKSDISAKIIGYNSIKQYELLTDMINQMSLQENIKLIGFVESHDEILMEVKKSRVFVLPTYADTGPRSVAEAMAIGTPVVSYNVDGMPFMVENNICGILAEKGNVKELAESIYSILSDDLLAARLSINAYDFAKEYFSLKKNTNELINIYKTIIDLEKSDENK